MSKLKLVKAKGFANEPTPINLKNQSQLISILNWYRNNELITLDDLKGYLVAYGKIKLPDIIIDLTKINYYTPYLVLARLYLIGWEIPDTLFKEQKLLDYIQTCKKVTKVEIIENSSNTIIKKQNTKEHLENLELYIDHKLTSNSYQYIIETNSIKIKEIIIYIEIFLNQLELDFKEGGYERETYKLLKTSLESLKDSYEKMKNTSKKSTSTRTINKNAMVKSVKYQIKKLVKNTKTFVPLDVVGKKKLYVFDESKSLLLCFFSNVGFTFSGTTLKDFTDKSIALKIKDTAILSNSLSELNDIMAKGKTKPVPSGRFNETMIILAIS